MNKMWNIWIDTGGTFTDCIAVSPDGDVLRRKVLSSGALKGTIEKCVGPEQYVVKNNWGVATDIIKDYLFKIPNKNISSKVIGFDPSTSIISISNSLTKLKPGDEVEITADEEAPILAIRLVTNSGLNDTLPDLNLKLGSTKGTNALLERKGNPPTLFVSKGFKDLLVIGNQTRIDLFALDVSKPKLLYDRVVEVEGRIDAKGKEQAPLDLTNLEKQESDRPVAISLLNAYSNPSHEQEVRKQLDSSIKFVSVASELTSGIKYLERTQTAVANAYLDPIITSYVDGIHSKLSPSSSFQIMSSSGGLLPAFGFKPKDSLLSGPAGGLVGARTIGKKLGRNKLLTFDMGGTSTDVSRIDGDFDYRFETKVGDATVFSPTLYIETVAAGGGSICQFDGHKYTVGPESGGASPGPACYGAGGPLTVTDVNLLLGRLNGSQFSIPIYKEQAQKALDELKGNNTEEEVLSGLLKIANEKMADAIRKISVAKGYKPEEYALLSFGGAGGLHACAVAELLDVGEIIIPYDAGILSAYGIGMSNRESFAERTYLQVLSTVSSVLESDIAELGEKAIDQLVQEGASKTNCQIKNVLLSLRLKGQDTSIDIKYTSLDQIEYSFQSEYEQLYGHWIDDREIEVESVKVFVHEVVENNIHASPSTKEVSDYEGQEVYLSGKWREVPVYDVHSFQSGDEIKGPAILLNDTSTALIEEGWLGTFDDTLNLVINNSNEVNSDDQLSEGIELELYTNRFASIAEEMGNLLQRTSFSVNIKERLDFSCAILDQNGDLVVNAPHIPVHLGAMGVCVKSVLKAVDVKRGDIVITNHPGFGGSHLPDVTLIAPVYHKNELLGYVANRSHHAEIGGKKPGSMPADATNLEEEGVIIAPMFIQKGGQLLLNEVRDKLLSGRYPSRNVEENMADLSAGLAALRLGQTSLDQLCEKEGLDKVKAYFTKLNDYAHSCMLSSIKNIANGQHEAIEYLDDGSPLSVKVTKDNDQLIFDFSGSSEVHKGNLNATKAIVTSAVLYVLKLIIKEPVPMNEGVLRNIELKIPEGMLNPDFDKPHHQCPAVVGGNVETSQRLVDTMIKALKLAACSQGTMNNLLFGNEKFGYYETICGGVGATENGPGADAVHQHMTNTRITDAEILELRYPVQVMKFEIRKGSGGAGMHKGGDGIIRQLKFTEEVDLTVLTQHRKERPFGMDGGESGHCGRQYIIKKYGSTLDLAGIQSLQLSPGDSVVIETPGGGGYGKV